MFAPKATVSRILITLLGSSTCLCALSFLPASFADDGSGRGAGSRPRGDAQGDYIIEFGRGDGTRGTFGAVVPSEETAQSQWFQLDQQARRSIRDGDLSQAQQQFSDAIKSADSQRQ